MIRSNRTRQGWDNGSGRRHRPATAPLRRPGAVNHDSETPADEPAVQVAASVSTAGSAPRRVTRLGAPETENGRLFDYESRIKSGFDDIVPVLKEISALQHERNFEQQAQQIAMNKLGFTLPDDILADAWVSQLDMKRLFAWCVFENYRRYCDDFYANSPLALAGDDDFESFLQACGFHTLDMTPCADGRLAHVIRYVLRLPQWAVRRKSYAGALFDVENSLSKWVEVEMRRYREGVPNTADAPTRYLKAVVYHFSSGDPDHQGCAAHGSDTAKAAAAGLERLDAFRTSVENSFCCGASIDLLLIGLDTDTDTIKVHLPDGNGAIDLEQSIDASALRDSSESNIESTLRSHYTDTAEGMILFASRLLRNNLAQTEYVRQYHGQAYADIGHAERFIGAGVGFEEVQLRNLMYFAYLNTVEEATADMDVGIKIFSGLNVSHGLPIPVVVRYDFHGQVPGARERAQAHCERVSAAIHERYADLSQQGLLHTMQVIRDCDGNDSIQTLKCTVNPERGGAH